MPADPVWGIFFLLAFLPSGVKYCFWPFKKTSLGFPGGSCMLSHFSHVQLFETLWTIAARLLRSWNLQARILEWVAISFSRASSWPWDGSCISCVAGRFFTTEPMGKCWWLSGRESTRQCRRNKFGSWSRNIPQTMEQLSPCTTTIEPVR